MSRKQTSVLVIGGGVAGLTTAAVLARAGVKVTLLEAGGEVGGKLDEGHGMHGWWRPYKNFFSLFELVGLDKEAVLSPESRAAFVYPDGQYLFMPASGDGVGGRLKMMRAMLAGGRLNVVDLLQAGYAMTWMPAFVHGADYERFDDISMHAYLAEGGATQALMNNLLEPLVHNFFFTSSKRISAAAALSGMGVYLFGPVDDVRPRYCVGEAAKLIVAPIADYIVAHGGEVVTDAPVTALLTEGEGGSVRVRGARIAGAESHTVPLADIPAEEPLLLRFAEREGVVIRRDGDGFVVLDRLCTHMGLALVDRVEGAAAGADAGEALRCPVHGCVFSLDGSATEDRCNGPLRTRTWRVEGDQLVITSTAERVYEADQVVLAVDPAGAAELLEHTPATLTVPALRQISSMQTTSSAVLRLWLDQPWQDEPTNGVFGQPGLADNFFVLSELQAEYRAPPAPARSVIEVHCYLVDGLADMPQAERDAWLVAHIVAELRTRLPKTFATARVVRSEVQAHPKNFSAFAPGTARARPEVQGPWPNLFFAGDWVRVAQPWWWMERAVATGMQAANAVLAQRGVAGEVPVATPNPPAAWRAALRGPWSAATRTRDAVARLLGIKPLRP